MIIMDLITMDGIIVEEIMDITATVDMVTASTTDFDKFFV